MTSSCWTTIGIHGDRTCPELQTHVHCRNCPVYAAAAHALLDRAADPADIAAATARLAAPAAVAEPESVTLVIFRIATEWLALPADVVKEVSALRPVHALPHRRNGAVLGVTNVRGELLVCVALGRLLALDEGASDGRARSRARLLVLRRGDRRLVCPADEVDGVHRIETRELQEVPVTIAQAGIRHTRALVSWRGHSVGLLDDEAVFHTSARSLS